MRTCEHQRRPRPCRAIASLAMLSLSVVAAAACGSTTPSNESAPAATPPAAQEGAAARVFFVQPQNGSTVTSPVHFEFGAEHIMISPVPEGEVTHARAGMGHHHLGVDTDCLPAGQEIPKGTPGWVHFGKGDNTIDMQLTPGPHKFALQVGDDQHRTIAGLCETMAITVK